MMLGFFKKGGYVEPHTIIDRRNCPCPKYQAGECNGVNEGLLKIERDELRGIVGEGVEKWLDKKFAEFGKWTGRAALAGVFAWAIKGIFTGDWRILP